MAKSNELTRAKLIVIEGPDNAGKSTQARLLGNLLRSAGYQVFSTAQPTRNEPYGARLRRILEGSEEFPGADEFARLFAMDRMHHTETELMPALMHGDVVVCDRYVLSSLAYQHGIYGLDLDYVRSLSRYVPVPDATLVFTVGEATVEARMRERGQDPNKMHHDKDAFDKVSAVYKHAKLALPEHHVEYVSGDGDRKHVTSSLVWTLVRMGAFPNTLVHSLGA